MKVLVLMPICDALQFMVNENDNVFVREDQIMVEGNLGFQHKWVLNLHNWLWEYELIISA